MFIYGIFNKNNVLYWVEKIDFLIIFALRYFKKAEKLH